MVVTSRYFFFLTLQTIGAGILLWYGIPLFRQVVADPSAHEPRPERLIWSLTAIALMQAGYWMRYRLNPPLPQVRNPVVGHIVLFAARMSFVTATSVFGFVFIIRRPELQVPFSRYVILVMALFALFCYVLELERLGRSMAEPK